MPDFIRRAGREILRVHPVDVAALRDHAARTDSGRILDFFDHCGSRISMIDHRPAAGFLTRGE
jgi:hypothetical protein